MSPPTYDTTADGDRVGPKMRYAVTLVSQVGPYPSANQLAIDVGPHGSQDYGYRIVNRCLSAGLLALDREHPDATPQANGAIVLTEKGAAFLRDREDA